MNATRQHKSNPTAAPPLKTASSGLIQRKCACGNHTIAGGECEECGRKKRYSLQTKLKVSGPGDIYEREAERIADQLMAAPVHSGISATPPTIQRYKEQSAGQTTAAPASVDLALASPGRPLEPTLRQEMELRFGYDFTAVRVHYDEQAARAADAIDASAFTLGNSIWFGRGMFRPETAFGQHLMAHELTHTIQQRGQPDTYGSHQVSATGDVAELGAQCAAEAVLTREAMQHVGTSGPVICRAPKVSSVPGDPSRRIVDLDDGSRYRVKRTVGLQQDTKTIPGEEAGPSLAPKIDKNNVWLQVNWCSTGKKGDIHGEVKVGADLPAAAQTALTDLGNDIKNGTDPKKAILKAKIQPFASVHIAQSKRFAVDLSGGPTIEPFGGGVTGGGGKASVKIGNVELSADVQVTAGSGRPDVRVIGGVTIPLGGPEKVTCKRTFVIPRISYQCEKIMPEHEEPKQVSDTRRHYFYYEFAKPEFAKRGRTATLDAEAKRALKQELYNGYRIDSIEGFASPEGAVGPQERPADRPKGFVGNYVLSKDRAKAAEDWVKGVCPPPTALSMRPSCFAEVYAGPSSGSELYGRRREAGQETGPELVDKALAEESVRAFEQRPDEAERRTPDVMEELEKRKTPERQKDTVYPLLRRAEIVVSNPTGKTIKVKVPESQPAPVEKCPTEVVGAVADDFDQDKK